MVTFSWFMPRQILGFLNHLFFLGMGWCLLLLLYKDARIPSTTLADRNKVRACPAASASAETDSITANCSCICISCSWCHNNSTSTWLPPSHSGLSGEKREGAWKFPLKSCLWGTDLSKQWLCVRARICTNPAITSKGRTRRSFKGVPLFTPFLISLCTHACMRVHTHICLP